jgi:MoaA/NifB/PqqE/SkfB family radical SAM enzyme
MKWADVTSLHLEISALCNAVCPQCARYPSSGYIALRTIDNSHVWTLEQVKKRLPPEDIHQLKSILINGTMGDFITNIEAMDIVKYFSENAPDARFIVNTNGSARTAEWWQELASIPKLRINFALDGLEDTHQLYRRNTNFNKILQNAKAFIDAGGQAEWTMTVFKHNQHQVEECKQLAKELGFNKFWARHSDRKKVYALDRNGEITHAVESADDSPVSTEDTMTEFQAKINHIRVQQDQEMSMEEYQRIEHSPMHNTIPLPNLDTCDSLRERQIYIGADWSITPCCFIGILTFTQKRDRRFANFHERLTEQGLDLADLKATDDRPVSSIINRGFDWIYDSITTDKALTSCYFHCHPKDAPFRQSQDNLNKG